MSKVLNVDTVIDKLSDVIELDYDAIAAYKAAIDRLDNTAYKTKLREFLADHERHVSDLSEIVREEGGTPPDSGDYKQALTKGQVVIADLAGDRAILKAMKLNEDQTNSLYEKMVNQDFPDHIQTLLKKGLSDERRHRAWIETTLEKDS